MRGGDDSAPRPPGANSDAHASAVDQKQPRQAHAGLPTSISGGSSSSYVYPVRSLLAGIQPANEQLAPAAHGTFGTTSAGKGMSDLAELLKKEQQNKESAAQNGKHSSISFPVASNGPSSPSMGLEQALANLVLAAEQQRQQYEEHDTTRPVADKPTLPKQDSNETVQASYSEVPPSPSGGAHVVILPGDRDDDEYNPRHPEPISSAGAEVMATAYTSPALAVPRPMSSSHKNSLPPSTPIDFSQTGIVHLPPLPSNPGSEKGSASGHGSGGSLTSNRDARSHAQSHLAGSGSDSQGIFSSDGSSRPPVGSTGIQSGSDSANDSAGEVVRSTSGLSSGSSELVTFRFEHIRDENGFHVVTGREGRLNRCEDEVCFSLCSGK